MGVTLDEKHWLTYGERSPMPLLVSTKVALVAKINVQVAGRFADGDDIRLSGLLWPEARERWSNTVGVSREALGKGQVILFSMQPNFRGYFHGGERLLVNAILFGPGLGARAPVGW